LYTFDDPLRKTRTKYNRVVSVVDKWMKKVHRLCPYLDTINRQVLDFDFEKLCSVSLSRINVYACLVCGKYFQGKVLRYNIILHSKQIAGHVSMCVCIFRGLVPIGDNLPWLFIVVLFTFDLRCRSRQHPRLHSQRRWEPPRIFELANPEVLLSAW
jgi:hypothetical protein